MLYGLVWYCLAYLLLVWYPLAAYSATTLMGLGLTGQALLFQASWVEG